MWYRAFHIHPEILNAGNPCDPPKSVNVLEELVIVEHSWKSVVKDAKETQNIAPTASTQGPTGTPAAKTIVSIGMVIEFLKKYIDNAKIHAPSLLEKADPRSLLTLVNEHFHSTLRETITTPTMLDICKNFTTTTTEALRKTCCPGFHYFTDYKKKRGYRMPTGLLSFDLLPNIRKPPFLHSR